MPDMFLYALQHAVTYFVYDFHILKHYWELPLASIAFIEFFTKLIPTSSNWASTMEYTNVITIYAPSINTSIQIKTKNCA